VVIWGIALVVLLVAGLGSYAWTMRPELIEIYPAAGATGVPVTTQIRMAFSRRMNAEMVISHLIIEPAVDGEYGWEENTLTFTPDQTWPGGQEINLHFKAGVRAASWLSFPMQGQSWSFKTSGAYLAYLWPSDGPADIYALNPITGEVQQYTHGRGVLEFTASSDGITIYFSASNAQGGADLYQIDRKAAMNSTDDSYKPRRLLNCQGAQCRSPAVSFDGMSLAYEYLIPTPAGGLGPAQIWILHLPGLEASPVDEATHETVQPVWSQTGWLTFYDRTSSTYEVINLQTQERVQLPNQTGRPGNWSPDGEFYLAAEMTYHPATGYTETGTSHLLRYRLQTGTTEDISGVDDAEDVDAVYSPEGGSIAFARKYLDSERWSFGRQIWMMDPNGSNSRPVTDEADYNHYDIAWSLDGLVLAYVRFNQAKLSEPPELWMIDADGGNPVQLVIGGYAPLWIP